MTVSYFLVTQPNVTDVETSPGGVGSAPTSKPMVGTVTFTPSRRIIETASPSATVYLEPILGHFTADGHGLEMANGAVGVQLVDNVGFRLAVGALTYLVDYAFHSWAAPSFRIAAPGTGATVDLNDPAHRLPV